MRRFMKRSYRDEKVVKERDEMVKKLRDGQRKRAEKRAAKAKEAPIPSITPPLLEDLAKEISDEGV